MNELSAALSTFVSRDPEAIARDCLDVLLVALVINVVLLLLQHTRATRIGVGLVLLLGLHYSAERLGLPTLRATLGNLLTWIGIVAVVVFHQDVRRIVQRLCSRPLFGSSGVPIDRQRIADIVSAATLLAQRRIGGLIVFERERPLEQCIGQGTVLDALLTKELLYSLFIPSHENPLHDGAVIIRDGHVWQAGAVLPLSTNAKLDRSLGTRHRAALGVSEETDALVLIVSQQRGEISLCYAGILVRRLDAGLLSRLLSSLLASRSRRHGGAHRELGRSVRWGSGLRRPPSSAIREQS